MVCVVKSDKNAFNYQMICSCTSVLMYKVGSLTVCPTFDTYLSMNSLPHWTASADYGIHSLQLT